MTEITRKAWEVYRSVFVDGKQVVLETTDGEFHWGVLTTKDNSILLTRDNGYSKEFHIDTIELLCHDGFPVRSIMKMSREEADQRADQTPVHTIREHLEQGKPSRYIGGGCPFVAGPFTLTNIFNEGNIGAAHWFDDSGEVLEFTAADGAVMHSYDTGHLFLL